MTSEFLTKINSSLRAAQERQGTWTPEDFAARLDALAEGRKPLVAQTAPADSFPRDENELKNLLIWLYRFSQSPRLERALDEKPAGRRIKDIVSGR